MIAASVCPDCGAGLVASDRFCGRCGTGIVRCADCGGIGLSRDRYCALCGRDLAPTDPPAPATDPELKEVLARLSPWEGVLQRLKAATVGEYEVIREIGRGGMAAVFLAHETALNRRVAIKVMSPGIMLSDGMVERFHQEAVTVANLTHSNIVTVHAVREVDDLHFFVMEFVAGKPLDKVIATAGQLAIPVVRAILSQVGSALAYAHRRGVIHRDVKPGNILLDADGQAIVTDFGIAKVIESPSTTQTGAVHGTAAYMSPEQCYAAPLTPASDQYSLGVVAYEMLAGRPPFVGDSSFALMQAHTTFDVPPLGTRRSEVPPDLEAAVLRMLAKKPNDRWPSMMGALSALQAFPVPPDDPVLEDLARLADVERARTVGDVLRTPASPVPNVPRRTPARPATAERPTERPADPVAPQSAPVTIPPRTVQVEPAALSMEVGENGTATATVVGGTPLSPSDTLVWSAIPIGVVRVDRRTGVISAQSPGTATVTASVAGVESSLTVTVSPAAVAALRIAPANTSPVVGDKLGLAATATDKAGRVLDRVVYWSTSAPEIGSISPNGELSLHAPGQLDVFAVCEPQRDELRLNVRRRPVARVEIGNVHESITAGETLELIALARDDGEAVLDGRSVVWTSSDRSLATVSDRGVVAAHNAGTVTISAKCEGKTASFRLAITPAPIASVIVSTEQSDLSPKQRVWLSAVVTDVRGTTVDAKLRWKSSDARIATVSDKGEVRAIRPGSVVISARADDIEGTVSLRVTAPVVAAPAPVVTPTAPRPTAAAYDDALTSPAAEMPRRPRRGPPVWLLGVGAIAVLGGGVFLLSGDPTSPSKPELPKDSLPNVVSTLAVSAPAAQVRVGESFVLNADVRGGSGRAATRWQSVTSSVVVDSLSGQVTAREAGRAIVVARNEAATDTVAFDVLPAPVMPPDAPSVASVEIQTPPSQSLESGDRVVLRAAAFDTAHRRVRTATVTWSTSDPTIAQVDPQTGEVVAARAGTVRITARTEARRAETMLVVRAPQVRDVIIAGVDQLESGQSQQLQATVRDTRNNLVSDAAVSWSSNNPSVVQIEAATGRMHAGDAGQATIRATVGSVSATRRIVVTKKPEVVVAADSAKPPPPTLEELLRTGEPRIKAAVDAYARALAARNIDQVRVLYSPANEDDRRNLDRLADLMKNGGLTLVRASVGTPRLESGQAIVDLSARLKWRSFVGANTERDVPFRAVFQWTGTEWRLVTCRIVGTPRLT